MSSFQTGLLLQAVRPQQWTKNLVVYAGIVFSRQLGDWVAVAHVSAAFAIFCLLSSGTYLLNDVLDAPKDRFHPLKSKRPVASGRLGEGSARVCGICFVAGSVAIGTLLELSFGMVCLGYAVLQLVYMYWLKNVVIADVLCISIGFILRAVGGGLVIGIVISHWLMVCTLFLALFLAVCKRRHELVLLGAISAQHRKALINYSEPLLDQMVAVATSSTVITYALYTVATDTQARFGGDQLKYTVPFVLFGIFRYLYLVYGKKEGGSPDELLLKDKPLLINIFSFGVAVGLLLYGR